MKIPRIAKAIGEIEDEIVAEATEKKVKTLPGPTRWIALAASLLVLVIAAAILIPVLNRRPIPGGRYKDLTVNLAETAVEWPYEALAPCEQYTLLTMNGAEFSSRYRSITRDLLGESLGTYPVAGYDNSTDTTHTMDCEVYRILHIDPARYVAVEIEGDCYVFSLGLYAPPATLGELLQAVELPEVIELSRFSENGDGPDARHFALEDDDPIWDLLAACQDAPFVDDQNWAVSGRSYLSFTVTSESLGVYKNALYVTEDGYLWTNAFDWMYLYDIGEDAAKQIIDYARSHAEEAAYEPYRETIIGRIIEINEDYLILDDTELCRDADDGMTYRIPLSDPRISRYVTYNILQVGDFVQAAYEGEIDSASGNTISGVLSLQEVYVTGEGIEILE